MAGRYAPSPTGPLHVGNLRTALVAWLAARSAGLSFYVRVEDLDPVNSSRAAERGQFADLAALGIDWDAPPIRQSERFDLYRDLIARFEREGLVYPCFCSRREIREEIEQSSRAPHAHLPDSAYPGTCRDLTAEESAERRTRRDREPALRLRADGRRFTVADRLAGTYDGYVDDFVLARADGGTPSYNLAVVVDDHLQGITQVVRGDDLLSSTPRHLLVYDLMRWDPPEYWHVPLVMDGEVRLAKRTGGVTLAELATRGVDGSHLRSALATSLGLAQPGEPVSPEELVERFRGTEIPSAPVQLGALGLPLG